VLNLLTITLVKSQIGAIPKHKLTLRALGLNKLNSSVTQKDNAAIRGMIKQISHLLRVEETAGAAGAAKSAKPAPKKASGKAEAKEA
jgi:large subunit ribosomal protein L30